MSEVSGHKSGSCVKLLDPGEVRNRCRQIGDMALNGNGNWFVINEPRFKRCLGLVRENCLRNYPDLKIPLFSRWRHFVVEGTDLWKHYTGSFPGNPLDLARSAADMAFLAVLMDIGTTDKWKYSDPVSGKTLCGSEGLAAASIDLFFNHAARYQGGGGWVLDAECLSELTRGKLASVFQSSADNPLPGLTQRAGLLSGLCAALANPENVSAGYVRPGNIVDECVSMSSRTWTLRKSITAGQILDILFRRFGSIWPNGYTVKGVKTLSLGDCGFHSGLQTSDETSGIIPFHRIFQWLACSLAEPVQIAGIFVSGFDELTGMSDYVNGGLFIDTGVLTPQDTGLMRSRLSPDSEAVVEWRALTVFLLDRIAIELRRSLKASPARLPMNAVMQGGTWAAGRELAGRLRGDGTSPLNIDSRSSRF